MVGVAANVRFDEVEEDPLPLAYLPILAGNADDAGAAYSMDVVLKASGDPLALVQHARGRYGRWIRGCP